ncbi:helix-turn-helix domain-containing protein [Bacillus badius]|uniref:helix-turn-helix domain-containing protein n=1 Tax=Bacillus badius TaxID=1455 RepID=UPI000AE28941|nr:helix-turn-helix transcriptional regulator [Bacillus badius]MED4718628.1 helix-turn-helix transcriptional regulator [Bacillus badius]
MKFKIHVEKFMKQKNLSVTKVSKDTGISRPTLTRYIKSTLKKVESKNIQALCCYFKCEPGDLVEFVDEENKTSAVV